MVVKKDIIYKCVVYFEDNISEPLEYIKVEGISKNDFKLIIDEGVACHTISLMYIDKILIEMDKGVGVIYRNPISRAFQYGVFDEYKEITKSLLDRIDKLSKR